MEKVCTFLKFHYCFLAVMHFSGCDSMITSWIGSRGGFTSPGLNNEAVTPAFKMSAFPTNSPEGFPYYSIPLLENFESSPTYSLQSSTCTGLSIDSSSGTISGEIKLVQGDSCHYKVQATSSTQTLLSDLVTVQIGASLELAFSTSKLNIEKGSSPSNVNLTFSNPTPFDTFLNYAGFSGLGNTGIVNLGGSTMLSDTGTIYVPKGSSILPIQISLPTTSGHTGVDIHSIKIENGSKGVRPELSLVLIENPSPNFSKISANSDHTCGISSGKLFCWGKNDAGQVGNGIASLTPVEKPTQIGTSTTWQDISSGQDFTCGIDNGSLYCWGSDFSGQMGNGGASSANVLSPQQVGVSTTWQMVSAGDIHVCAINSGALYCWGSNGAGATGNGVSGGNVTSPIQIGVSTTWTSISAGLNFSCGINTGALFCWGSDSNAQLGNGSVSTSNVLSPQQIGSATNWQAISTAKMHTCGIESGQLYCWGYDGFGQQGNGSGSTGLVHDPTVVNSSTTWQKIDVDGHSSCGIDNGRLFCWGQNNYGQIGDGTSGGNIHVPTQIGSSTSWSEVTASIYHTCGIDSFKVKCWGLSTGLGMGRTQRLAINSLTQIGKSEDWQLVSSSYTNTCGLRNGSLYCWGSNSNGEVGNSASLSVTTPPVRSPERIGFATGWSQISSSYSYNCGIESGKLYCWGDNLYGQLGIGITGGQFSTPQRIGTSIGWQKVSTGQQHTCGIDSGKLYCWGDNNGGYVGDGTGVGTVTSPIQIGVSSNWTHIGVNAYHTCGINSGELYCWGEDFDGQLGNGAGSSANVLAPQKIDSATNWSEISEHTYAHSCGIKGGELYCWGRDFEGQVGNGSASMADVRTPEKIGLSTSWQKVFTGNKSTCGIDAGALYCWGDSFSNGTAPTQVGSATNWEKGSYGTDSGCLISAGKLFCFGTNTYGQSGFGIGNITTPEALVDF